MAVITPSILAENLHTYRAQMERVEPFAKRIHIDLTDGEFAPSLTISPMQLYWPESVQADLHIMFKEPFKHVETLVDLKPHLVILHSEAEGELLDMFDELKAGGVKAGLALLSNTAVESVEQLIGAADHVLIFAGKLGYFGGKPDLSLLKKIKEIRQINPQVEIGWDGGVNEENAIKIVNAGVDVLTVGGFIQKAESPVNAYAILEQIAKGKNINN